MYPPRAAFRAPQRQLPGGAPLHHFSYLLESVNESGELVSLTSWDSREDAEVFEQSEAYSAALGKLGQYLVARPEVETYEVRE